MFGYQRRLRSSDAMCVISYPVAWRGGREATRNCECSSVVLARDCVGQENDVVHEGSVINGNRRRESELLKFQICGGECAVWDPSKQMGHWVLDGGGYCGLDVDVRLSRLQRAHRADEHRNFGERQCHHYARRINFRGRRKNAANGRDGHK